MAMKLTIQREELLKPLQMVVGAVERRQTLPILSNVLLDVKSHQLSMVATDMEVELVGRVTLKEPADAGEITVPARKLIDICRTLPDESVIELSFDEKQVLIKSGRSRFTLSSLAAEDFPKLEDTPGELEFNIKKKDLHHLIETTAFAMAQQDVRYYLNGLLLDVSDGVFRTVATDGHRLSLCALNSANARGSKQIIIPRKGVTELMRLLDVNDDEVTVAITSNHIRVTDSEFTFTSKLIDGRFPDYERVIPKNGDKIVSIERDVLKSALARVSILSNEKYRGVRIQVSQGVLHIQANNPEHEEAEEELEIIYNQEELDIGFNVTYLLDVLNTIPAGEVKLSFTNSNSSILLESGSDSTCAYVIMPMRL